MGNIPLVSHCCIIVIVARIWIDYHTYIHTYIDTYADTKILWRTFWSDCSVFDKYRTCPSAQKWWASVARLCGSYMCTGLLFPCRSGRVALWKSGKRNTYIYDVFDASILDIWYVLYRLVIRPSFSTKDMAPFWWRRPSASPERNTAPRRSLSFPGWAPDTTIESLVTSWTDHTWANCLSFRSAQKLVLLYE